jgi:hypothetical protein
MKAEQPPKKGNYYNETTNTFAGIPTPHGQEDIAATDPLSEAVEAIMDNLNPGADEE